MSFTILSAITSAAARLNDAAQADYTTAALLPFAKDAAEELQDELELYGIQVLETKSAIIIVPANTVQLSTPFGGGGSLIPTDMMEPQKIVERLSGSTDLFMDTVRRQWEPEILPTTELRYWTYRDEDIFFVGALTTRDIKIYYIKNVINIVDQNSNVNVKSAKQFMINRIAAMGARYVGENPTRADELDGAASKMLDKVIRIGMKGKQGHRARRRPFVITGRRRWV
jgi:hypothetical protein